MKKKKYPFWYRHHRALLVLGSLLIVLVAVMLVLWPKTKTLLSGGMNDVDQKKAQRDQVNMQLSQVRSASQEYRTIPSTQVDLLNVFLPKEEDIPLLLKQLEKLASDHGLILRGIEFGKVAAADTSRARARDQVQSPFSKVLEDSALGALSIKMTVAPGDYETIKPFLMTLEEYQRLIDVLSFTIEKVDPVAGGGETTIEMRTYYLNNT